jgi:hypothetical protein
MKMKHVQSAVAVFGGLFTAVHPALAQDWTLTSAPNIYVADSQNCRITKGTPLFHEAVSAYDW